MKRFLIFLFFLMGCTVTLLFAANKGENAILAVEAGPLNPTLDQWGASFEMLVPFPNVTAKAKVQYSPNLLWSTGVSALDLEAKGRFLFGPFIPFALGEDYAFLKGGGLTGPFVGAGLAGHLWTNRQGSSITAGVLGEVGTKVFFDRHWYAEATLKFEADLPSDWIRTPWISGVTAWGYVY